MLDEPDPRKVHVKPIPRVGGIGIVVGSLVPLFILLPHEPVYMAFITGSLILFFFGLWDDAMELGHYVKFIGQFMAVGLVVYWGNLYVHYLPLIDQPLSEPVGKVFTFIAMVGVINALNHSDGLDGLAGGESLMSVAAIIYLASQADGNIAILIGVASLGGVFGFLRYNSHPANVFMGDGGSQYLGFMLAFLTVYLTQTVNPVLSPASPLLLLGLPIADILAVFAQRIYHKMNWFKATKNHVHHRLLELGFLHHESVVIIYSVQLILVAVAVLMPYAADSLLLVIYFTVITILFMFLYLAEKAAWKVDRKTTWLPDVRVLGQIMQKEQVTRFLDITLQLLLAVFVTTSVVMVGNITWDDMLWAATLLFTAILIRLLLGYRAWFLNLRLLLFTCMAFFVYQFDQFSPVWLFEAHSLLVYAFFALIVLLLVIAMKFVDVGRFQLTPLDFLVILLVVVAGLFPEGIGLDIDIRRMMIEMVILFYAVEWVLRHMKRRWNIFTMITLVSLAAVTVRGLFS
jgi:UDP-GlcNAc:undecaprenyl-phosphate GlcNAc-1-phosphate transferase